MSRKTPRFVLLLVCCLTALIPQAGCVIGTDMLNPDFLSALGFDPDTIIASQGSVIFAINNMTQATITSATFAVADSVLSTGDEYVTTTARDIASSEVRQIVLDCPVNVLLPGAVTLVADEGSGIVAYEGSIMVAGEDFLCGDVVELRVLQAGTAAGAVTYSIQVRVIAGS